MCRLSRVHVHLSGHRFADAYSAALEVRLFFFGWSLFVLTAASAGSQLRVRSADDNRARSSRYGTAYCMIMLPESVLPDCYQSVITYHCSFI